jgi:hypothetical protein
MLQINRRTVAPHIKQQRGQANVNGAMMKNMSSCIVQTTQLQFTEAL